MTRAAVLGLAALALVLAGCGTRPQTSAPPAPTAPASGPRPAATATIAIASPSPGERISGTTIHVRIQLQAGTIVPQTSSDLRPDRGHIHISLDGKVVSMAYGVEQDVAVTPGTHLLTAEFVATDHFPFNPRVIKTVTFDVQ